MRHLQTDNSWRRLIDRTDRPLMRSGVIAARETSKTLFSSKFVLPTLSTVVSSGESRLDEYHCHPSHVNFPQPQPHSHHFSLPRSVFHQLCAYALCAAPSLSRSCAIPSFTIGHRGYLIIAQAQRRRRESVWDLRPGINQVNISVEECGVDAKSGATPSTNFLSASEEAF
jgi:hypothetical protein